LEPDKVIKQYRVNFNCTSPVLPCHCGSKRVMIEESKSRLFTLRCMCCHFDSDDLPNKSWAIKDWNRRNLNQQIIDTEKCK